MANVAGTGTISADMQASLDAQRQLMAQNLRDTTAQTMFQDDKHHKEEALKAISDAVKDAHQNRKDMISNIKST